MDTERRVCVVASEGNSHSNVLVVEPAKKWPEVGMSSDDWTRPFQVSGSKPAVELTSVWEKSHNRAVSQVEAIPSSEYESSLIGVFLHRNMERTQQRKTVGVYPHVGSDEGSP